MREASGGGLDRAGRLGGAPRSKGASPHWVSKQAKDFIRMLSDTTYR